MCLEEKMQENEPIAVTANAERYYPEDKQGLTAAQVEERQRKGLVNAAVDQSLSQRNRLLLITYLRIST